jgi:LmbE family N-acetylglucosaminyl deacetylase
MAVDRKRVLVLGGHLDDSVIAVGGIIRKLVERGCVVSVVCFGNGDEAFAHTAERESAPAVFREEAVRAHRILGVEDFQCLDLPDFAVQENRADFILGHSRLEYFQHRAMARLSCDAWWQAGWACSADLGAPWAARALYHFEVLQTLPEPTHIVDISDVFASKLEAWRQFATAQDHLQRMAEQLEARARFRGSLIGVQYAEALCRSYFNPQPVVRPEMEL